MSTPLVRPVEASITRDLRGRLSYSEYLCLDQLLGAQQPLSTPPHHDELLFIVQHQTTELWFKLIIHELRAALSQLAADLVGPALKGLARVKHIQRQLFEQWAVLETLTPSEYSAFRAVLGAASGFQSQQYRLVEFLLGNKNADNLAVFAHQPAIYDELQAALEAPSLYEAVLALLARRGHAIPGEILSRDHRQPWVEQTGLIEPLRAIYADPERDWDAYHLCEQLVDIEESFQLWRFRHLKTVERIIGYKPGTGGSSGVHFLRQALDLRFFPELLAVRTALG